MSDVRVTSRNDGVINRILFIRSPLLNTNALRLFNPANPRLKSGICEVIIDDYLQPSDQPMRFIEGEQSGLTNLPFIHSACFFPASVFS